MNAYPTFCLRHSVEHAEAFIRRHSNKEGSNWFANRLTTIKRDLLVKHGKPETISQAIEIYNDVKSAKYEKITNAAHLADYVDEIFDREIDRWITAEGAYKVLEKVSGKEDFIQKTLKMNLQNIFMREGFRANQILVNRESQFYNDMRTDYLISYGFIGPILCELKLDSNPEVFNLVKRTEYREKLLGYMHASRSRHAFYLLFGVGAKEEMEQYSEELKKQYQGDNVKVKSYFCAIPSPKSASALPKQRKPRKPSNP